MWVNVVIITMQNSESHAPHEPSMSVILSSLCLLLLSRPHASRADWWWHERTGLRLHQCQHHHGNKGAFKSYQSDWKSLCSNFLFVIPSLKSRLRATIPNWRGATSPRRAACKTPSVTSGGWCFRRTLESSSWPRKKWNGERWGVSQWLDQLQTFSFCLMGWFLYC